MLVAHAKRTTFTNSDHLSCGIEHLMARGLVRGELARVRGRVRLR